MCVLSNKKYTQNDFVYGEIGQTSFQNSWLYMIIKYWLKLFSVMKIIAHLQYDFT